MTALPVDDWSGAQSVPGAESVPAKTVAPVERDCQIPALDGLLLGATVFEPPGPGPRRVLFIASATGVKRARYHPFARFLAGRGWSVITFDYRGIGDSRSANVRSLDHTMFEWGERDIAGVISWIDQQWAPSSMAAVTHSIGGQVLPFAANHHRLNALVMVGSQKGYWKLWSGRGTLAYFFFRAIWPLVRLLGYLPLGFAGCEDLPPRVAIEWGRWGLHHDFVDAKGCSLNDHHARFAAPILALSFSDDVFAPPRAVEKLLEFYSGAPREHRHFHPAQFGLRELGHSGFFDGPARETLWQQVAKWLSRHSGL